MRLMYKLSLVHLRIKPRQTCHHLQIGNNTKPLNQKILPLMKLAELYVHIYYYTLNNILYIKLLCMHDAMTINLR